MVRLPNMMIYHAMMVVIHYEDCQKLFVACNATGLILLEKGCGCCVIVMV